MSISSLKSAGKIGTQPRVGRVIRTGLIIFFVLLIFDGALRKWVLPGVEAAIFLLKDVVLWGAFLAYSAKRDPVRLPDPVYSTWIPLLLSLYIFVVFLQAFNVRQPSLTVSALGLKAHLSYLPLVVLVPPVVYKMTDYKISKILWVYAVFVVVPIGVLSVYQFSQPPSAWINKYVGTTTGVAKVGGSARITGTFPYMGSYVKYLRFNAVLGFSTIVAGVVHKNTKAIVSGTIILLTTALVLPMTGTRSPLVVISICIISLFLITKRKYAWGRLLAMFMLLFFGLTLYMGDSLLFSGWEALIGRIETSGLGLRRVKSFLMGPLTGLEEVGILGYGVGTNHQVAPNFVSGPIGEGRFVTENKPLRVFAELGAVGFLVLSALKVALLEAATQVVRSSKGVLETVIGGTAFCVILMNVLMPVVYNVVVGSIFWGMVGAMIGVWSSQYMRRNRTGVAQSHSH